MKRAGGSNRFATAGAVARALPGTHAYPVDGAHPHPARGWSDAVSVGSLAAHQRAPIVLGAARRDVGGARGPRDQEHHRRRRASAISDGVVAQLRSRGFMVERVAGADRYATSAAVASRALAAGMSAEQLLVATGRDRPDSLAAGPLAAARRAPLLLVDGRDAAGATATRAWIAQRADSVATATVTGGTLAITGATEVAIERAADRRGPLGDTPARSSISPQAVVNERDATATGVTRSRRSTAVSTRRRRWARAAEHSRSQGVWGTTATRRRAPDLRLCSVGSGLGMA